MECNSVGHKYESHQSNEIILSNALPNRPEKTFRRFNCNIQSYNKPNKTRQKLPGIMNKNDSTQLMNSLSNKKCEPRKQKENRKNISHIGPFSQSITYKPHIQRDFKTGDEDILSKQKTTQYRPYLAETQPEYVGNDDSSSKSLQEIKDINKKYSSLLGKNKAKRVQLVQTTKRNIFSPIKLCDERKFSRHLISRVKLTREVPQISSANAVRRRKKQLSQTSTTFSSRDIGVKSRHSTSKKNRVPLNANASKQEISETHSSNCRYRNNIDYECHGCPCTPCSASFDENSRPLASRIKSKKNVSNPENFLKCHAGSNSCCYNSSDSEVEDPCQKCPCPLHNIIKFRNENFLDTHATPIKDTNSQSKYQTYILDERLFPVLIQSNIDGNERSVNKDPADLVSSSTHKSFLTLRSTADSTSLQGKTNHKSNLSSQPENSQKTSEPLRRVAQFSLAPTNSLALKHQKGVR